MKPVARKTFRSSKARKVPKNHPWRHSMVTPRTDGNPDLPLKVPFRHLSNSKNKF